MLKNAHNYTKLGVIQMSRNKVTILGKITKIMNSHIKHEHESIVVDIETTRSSKTKGQTTLTHRCIAFGKGAQLVRDSSIGTIVYLEGEISYTTVMAADGRDVNETKILVHYLQPVTASSQMRNHEHLSDESIGNRWVS